MIEKLLLPFVSTPFPENQCLFEPIAKFLIRTFHDPRLSREHWHGVNESAKQAILRWLAGVDLKGFFTILDRSVGQGRDSHHWPFRKAFWLGYHNKNQIVEAWVLLGARAQQYVNQIEGWELKAHGRLLRGSGVQPNHSVLLLKFKDGTVLAEWSHSGKGRFWLPDNKNAPSFYKDVYSRKEVTEGFDHEFIHHGSENYSWQKRVAFWIYSNAGISIRDSEYRVR
jgi:hypothetical protein